MSFEIKKATRIPLTKGLFAEIDASDFQTVCNSSWYAMKSKHTHYAATNSPMIKGKRGKTILMHALISGSTLTDHKDGNGLNNRRENLRPANRSLNAVNSKIRAGKTSKFRGVLWDKSRCKWAAYIKIDGKTKNLGRFDSEIVAAEKYRMEAIKQYGEFVK